MADSVEQNNNAKRKVLETSPYLNLIEKGSCSLQYESTGDTKHTVTGMKEFVLVHREQTKVLANELLGSTLQETVQNNYDFLYKHLQYESDSQLQQMRSPECSISSRLDGIDCKSYSIFASSLLLNQDIRHFIRRIKQPNYYPKNWTHVYVIVPSDQEKADLSKGYYVIDGTLHINKEPLYNKKHDIEMGNNLPHVWLNGAAGNDQQGNGSISTVNASDGFCNFLELLLNVGVQGSQVSSIQQTINQHLANNGDPGLRITNAGITIQGQYIPYKSPSSRESVRFGSAIAYVNQFSENPKPVGLNGGLNGSGDEIGDLEEVLSGILNDDWFGDTFGTIFQNGFDFSCYNSSNNPQQSAAEVPIDARYYLEQSGLKQQINIDTIDSFLYLTGVYLWAREYGMNNGDLAKCTRKGNEVGFRDMLKFRNDIVAAVRNTLSNQNIGLDIDTRITVQSANVVAPSGYHDGRINVSGTPIQIRKPQLSGNPADGTSLEDFSIQTTSNDTNTNTNSGGSDTTESNNNNNTNNGGGSTDNGTDSSGGSNDDGTGGSNQQKAGMSPVLGIGLVAAAIGTYYLNKNSSKPNKTKAQ